MLANILAAGVIALEAVAVFFMWRAVRDARTSQGAMGWVLFLILAPFLAVPLFLFLGHHRFAHFVVARRNSATVAAKLRVFGATHAPDRSAMTVDPTVFERLADLPVVSGNDYQLLKNGSDTFQAIFQAIDEAQHYVLVQFYIFRDDALGRDLKARLIAAARRGVFVALNYDRVGSVRLPQGYLDELEAAGVNVPSRASMRGAKTRFQLNFRNHRKTVVVDGRVGFIGGHNVGDEYLGKTPPLAPWRDTHIRLTGPMVTQLQLIFVEDWHWQTDENFGDVLRWEAGHSPQNRTGLLVPTGPGDDMETGALLFFAAICAAEERVWIASPYFVPDRDVLSALKFAALKGVNVRLLLPRQADHWIVWLAGQAFFDEVRAAGVEIWLYEPGFMHQKVILVDDRLAGVGTTNLDNRSFRLNFEAMALLFDRQAAEDVAGMLDTDFAQAQIVVDDLSKQSFARRVGARVARLFAPIL